MVASSNYNTAAAAVAGGSASVGAAGPVGDSKRPYFGKCQYKTGKCFNERTLKRNGDAHSLCEEHRVKQNLIQRRSDRKYQTVHAIRRRERSQRRAVLKKQVSMAVAQQLFYEHQQQKSMGMQQLVAAGGAGASLHQHPAASLPLLQHHSHSLTHALSSVASLAPPIQIPGKMDLSHFMSDSPAAFLSSSEGLASPILSFAAAARRFSGAATNGDVSERDTKMTSDEDDDDDSSYDEEEAEVDEPTPMLQQRRTRQLQQRMAAAAKDDNSSPTGIDDFAPDSFLSICASDEESDAAYANLVPIMSSMGEREMWTEDDIEFLQSVLLA